MENLSSEFYRHSNGKTILDEIMGSFELLMDKLTSVQGVIGDPNKQVITPSIIETERKLRSRPSVVEEESKYEVSESKEYSINEHQDVGEQIDDSIKEHFDPSEVDENKRHRGRPETIKDLSLDKLTEILDEYQEDLAIKLKKEQRSDALFATIGRYVKRVPGIFLKYIGSKGQYKSKFINSVLKSYTKTFLKGFGQIFKCEDHPNLRNLFIDFILLCFPESKGSIILEKMLEENAIEKDSYDKKIMQLEKRKKASKHSFKDLYECNEGFRIIGRQLNKRFKLQRSDQAKFNRIVGYLVSLDSDGTFKDHK